MSKLFSPISIRNLKIKNRIVMAPMCIDSAANDGMVTEWHYIHYVTRAIGGVGLIILESTAVESNGRITQNDLGIWDDSHIEGLKKIATQCKRLGAKIGIQLGHAGRKCEISSEKIIAPSPLPYTEDFKVPVEMTKDDIREVIVSFKKGALRAFEAGFDAIELHGAHGYLINQFLSPLSNKRQDEYGGSVENRSRFLREILKELRTVLPKDYPIFLRVSAEDYEEEGNHPEDLAAIINNVKEEGLDLIDVSSGGVTYAYINTYPGYQINYAETIRKNTDLPVIAGGLVTTPELAEEIIQNERADFVFLGRELLRNPYWPLITSSYLEPDVAWPVQYERGKTVRKGGF